MLMPSALAIFKSWSGFGLRIPYSYFFIVAEFMPDKANNLEYDIVANNKVTNQKLIGEAKAWDKKISSEIMAFIAKMMHFWIKEPNDWGIFISISDLTSDVKQLSYKILRQKKR